MPRIRSAWLVATGVWIAGCGATSPRPRDRSADTSTQQPPVVQPEPPSAQPTQPGQQPEVAQRNPRQPAERPARTPRQPANQPAPKPEPQPAPPVVSPEPVREVVPAARDIRRHFGFYFVDAAKLDPGDTSARTVYTEEVYSFTTIGHLLTLGPKDRVDERIDRMFGVGMRPVLAVGRVFFNSTREPTFEGGYRISLAPDAQERWTRYVELNSLRSRADVIAAIYLVDEPIWHGLSNEELARAAAIVEADFPNTPIMIIEAAKAIKDLTVPREVDWIGFDRYGVMDPEHDPGYLRQLESLKRRRSRPDQKLVIVMETRWVPEYEMMGVPPERMGDVAWSYMRLAQSEADAVAVMGFTWPGGIGALNEIGARSLPPVVRRTYRMIGQELKGLRPEE